MEKLFSRGSDNYGHVIPKGLKLNSLIGRRNNPATFDEGKLELDFTLSHLTIETLLHTHVLPLRHREFHVSVHLLVLFHPSENFNLFRGRYQSGLVSISQFVTGLRRRIFNRVPIPSFDPLPRRFLLVPETKSCVGPPL